MAAGVPECDARTPSETRPSVTVDDVLAAVVSTDLPVEKNIDESTLPPQVEVLSDSINPRSRAGFLHLYGWMGLPMVVVFFLSAGWTIALAVVQHIPTPVANWLMNTQDLDRGEFWLLEKPDDHIAIPAIILLTLFAAGYLVLVVLMFFPDKLLRSVWDGKNVAHNVLNPSLPLDSRSSCPLPTDQPEPVGGQQELIISAPQVRPADVNIARKANFQVQEAPPRTLWQRVVHETTSPNGQLRHYYNPMLDLPKLVFQTTTLFTYLHNGFPVAVIFIYSCLLFVNWIISSYRYKRERPDPHLVIVRVFYSFDLFFAVFAPMEVLIYAYYSFHFDRDEFATRVATLNPGSFDRTARLFADPTQVSLFRIAFHYLQFTTTSSLFIKCALNVLSIFKWERAIFHLVENARTQPPKRNSNDFGSAERLKLGKVRRCQQVQNWLIAGLFICAGTAVFIHAIVAVVSSQHVCKPHSQCKVPSYQWNVGATHCSCIVFVDRDTGLKTMAEWENPVDTTANLAELATTGHLQIVQIINRQLPTLPDELRNCSHLDQLILIYTKTTSIPGWAKEFRHLEYLHIEGDFTSKQLTSLPPELFSSMSRLLFLHLGGLVKLASVPDLSQLLNLEYLVMAALHSVTEIPNLNNLLMLKRLSIIDAIQVYSLPPIHQLRHLKTFTLTNRNPVCCNGFLTGQCDLSAFMCLNRTASGEPLVQCTDKRVGEEDYKVMISTDGIVCDKNLTFDLKNVKPTLASTDDSCGGVMFKQCMLGGGIGICFPARMQPISCQLNKSYQQMRRMQIERGVGTPCDPSVEGWLGCQA